MRHKEEKDWCFRKDRNSIGKMKRNGIEYSFEVLVVKIRASIPCATQTRIKGWYSNRVPHRQRKTLITECNGVKSHWQCRDRFGVHTKVLA